MTRTTSSRLVPALATAAVCAVCLAGCEPGDLGTAVPGAGPAEIVNGDNCSDSTCPAAVGALVDGWGGAFCTATLIDASWVLTAAHCVSGYDTSVDFLVGNDEDTGDTYNTNAAYAHPDYDSELVINDIALVHLSSPMSSAVATPIPINTTSLTDADEGEPVFYVGFGATGSSGYGSGTKRYTEMELYRLGEIEYTSQYADTSTGICYGDSGGPGIYDLGSGDRVIGVNSTVSSTGGDECMGYYNDTRVDAYAAWINDYLGDPIPDCNDDIGICWCDDACQTDGTCDNDLCGVDGCGDTYMCMAGCDGTGACTSDCYIAADPIIMDDVDDVINCFYNQCNDETTPAGFYDCILSHCSGQIESCWEVTLCDLLGGDCGAGAACRVADYGFTDCISTDTAGYGESCNPSAVDPTSCGDGYICLNEGSMGGICHQFCVGDGDCTDGGGECGSPVFGVPNDDVGICDDDFSTTDSDTDVDTDSDTDADTDSDTDVDSDADSDSDGDTDGAGMLAPSEGGCACTAAGREASAGLLTLLFG